MLDIKIVNLGKKSLKVLNKEFTVTEKFDGTKLSLVRLDNEWNEDYRKNWIVSFKNQIIFSEEFENLDLDKIKEFSVGISQYKIVHEHLKSIHYKTKNIPKSTEFFIEFLQRKPTLVRDYESSARHKLFLIGYSPISYKLLDSVIITEPEKLNTERNQEFSKILNLDLPTIIYKGRLDNFELFKQGWKHQVIKKRYNNLKDNIKLNEENSYFEFILNLFSTFESTVGGDSEGAVLQGFDEKKGKMVYYKVVKESQYDKTFRLSKKQEFDILEKDAYWSLVREAGERVLEELTLTHSDYKNALKMASNKIYKEIEFNEN